MSDVAKGFRVWFAGDDPEAGHVVFAATHEEAVLSAAHALFDPNDPLDRFDVFAIHPRDLDPAHAGPAAIRRFTLVADITRVSFDQKAGTMNVKGVEFTLRSPLFDIEGQPLQEMASEFA